MCALFFFNVMAHCQTKISLNEFKQFTRLKSNNDFEELGKKYKYVISNSNLAASYQYDELGFIKQTKLKHFDLLKNGDSILFNRFFKIYGLGKKINNYNNHISFFQKKDGVYIDFSATSLVADNDYFEQLMQECKTDGFSATQSDTIYSENTILLNYEAQKEKYVIKCHATIVKETTENNSTPTETIKYRINFFKRNYGASLH